MCLQRTACHKVPTAVMTAHHHVAVLQHSISGNNTTCHESRNFSRKPIVHETCGAASLQRVHTCCHSRPTSMHAVLAVLENIVHCPSNTPAVMPLLHPHCHARTSKDWTMVPEGHPRQPSSQVYRTMRLLSYTSTYSYLLLPFCSSR